MTTASRKIKGAYTGQNLHEITSKQNLQIGQKTWTQINVAKF